MLTALLAATLLSGTYVNERCGFAFEYPPSWTVVENPKAKIMDPGLYETRATCAVGLQPPGWRKVMRESIFDIRPYPIRVVLWNKPFEQAALDAFFYRNEDGEWAIASRGGPAPVTRFTTACCRVMRGSSWARIWSRDHQVGTATWEGAVINDRKGRSIVIESDEDYEFQPVVTQIIKSMRLQVMPVRRALPPDHACTASQSLRRIP